MNKSDEVTNKSKRERLVLPPISSINANFTSRSWPPPSTLSPSALSTTSSNVTMQEVNSSSSNNLSPIQHQPSNQDPWSPIPNLNENSQHHNNRLDYFTSAPPSSSNHTLSSVDQQQQQHHYHYRQNSLPQISTLNRDVQYNQNNSTNASIELVLTPSSLSTPSIRSIEKDIEQVSRYCNGFRLSIEV